MLKDVICNKGECHEIDRKKQFFDNMFEENNMVYKIEKDLWRRNFYGS